MKPTFYYLDIETVHPSHDPDFWFGGCLDPDGSMFYTESLAELAAHLLYPTDPEEMRFVVAHNGLGYDAPMIFALLHEADATWNIDAPSHQRGDKRVHRFGNHHWEVYARSWHDPQTPANPVVFLDSMRLIPGSLASWGKTLGMPKGETPLVQTWRTPTAAEVDYWRRDVEILAAAYRANRGEELAAMGIFTASGAAKRSIDEFSGTARARTFSARRKEGRVGKLPPKVHEAAQATLRAYEARCKAEHPLVTEVSRRRERSKAKEAIETAYRQALGVKAQQMVQARAKHPGKPLTRTQQDRWNAIKAPAWVDFDVSTCVVSHSGLTPEQEARMRAVKTKAEVDRMIRPALRGGISRPFLSTGQVVGPGVFYDVNSMYPAIMLNDPCYGQFAGHTKGEMPLARAQRGQAEYIAQVRLRATLRPGHHATIKRQEQLDPIYQPVLDWQMRESWLTSLEIEQVLFADYDVEVLEFGHVYYFAPDAERTSAVRAHIRHWEQVKNSTPHGSAEYKHAKLQMNNVWGRWAMTTKLVKQEGIATDVGDPKAPLSAAIFVTAAARVKLAGAIRALAPHVVASDTDSIAVVGVSDEDVQAALEVHDTRFGAWAREGDKEFVAARFLKPKTYILERADGSRVLTTAGSTFKGEVPTVEEFTYGWSGVSISRQVVNGKPELEERSKTITRSVYADVYADHEVGQAPFDGQAGALPEDGFVRFGEWLDGQVR